MPSLARLALAVAAPVLLLPPSAAASPFVLDFETEDDFVTPLINGQAINTDPEPGDPHQEFGRLVAVRSTVLGGDGHLGPAVFDSTPGGPNAGSADPDLLVDLGNILMLQNDDFPDFTIDPVFGKVFDDPNDEQAREDRGSILLDFLQAVTLTSIDLIDVNGGNHILVVLTDGADRTRTYDVPEMWTHDVTDAPVGFDTLRLDTLVAQQGEGAGGDATASEDLGFDPDAVVSLEIVFDGNPATSGAIDNIRGIATLPEPGTALLVGSGLAVLGSARRRRSSN